uniref:Rhodanese domain-containing protein n=1 Tax=Panagrolaimus sp. PS1159 TaxID=55785 RepID=A0AC35GXB4_9BILA
MCSTLYETEMQRFFYAKSSPITSSSSPRSNILLSSTSSSTDSAVSSSSSVSPSSCESIIDSDMGSPNSDQHQQQQQHVPPEYGEIALKELADLIRNSGRNLLIMDCRNFVDYNHCHIAKSINTLYSRIMRKRLVDNKS